MYLIELVLMLVWGTVFIILGWRIWKKEQITLIHAYHYKKVTEESKKPYTEKIGKAVILMGVGMYLTGAIDFITRTSFGWIAFGICFIGGLIIMYLAQKKYNHGVF